MEKKGSDQVASDSWWLEKNGGDNNRPHQSQWLQSTLAELERKIRMISELVGDNGDTFAQRAEMYYKRRPELIKVVEDLQRSYISLANKFDLVRSESLCCRGSSSSNSLRLQYSVPSSAALETAINPKISDHDQHQYGPHHVCTSSSNSELVPESWTLSNLVQSLMMSKDACDEKLRRDKGDGGGSHEVRNINGDATDTEMNGISARGFDNDSKRDSIMSSSSENWENTWNKMKSASELIENNLSPQAELIRRNSEKREFIKQLAFYISQLQNENKRLKDSLAQQQQQQQQLNTTNNTIDHQVKQNRSHMSKLKGLVLGKKL